MSVSFGLSAAEPCRQVWSERKATKSTKPATRRASTKRPSISQTRVVAPIAQLPRIGSQMQEVLGSNRTLGGLWVSQFQASGGISALPSRAPGLQSTTKGKLADKGGSPTSWRQAIHGQEHSIAYTVWYYIILYHIMLYHVILHYIILCIIMLYYSIFCLILHYIISYNVISCYITLHYIMYYYAIL